MSVSLALLRRVSSITRFSPKNTPNTQQYPFLRSGCGIRHFTHSKFLQLCNPTFITTTSNGTRELHLKAESLEKAISCYRAFEKVSEPNPPRLLHQMQKFEVPEFPRLRDMIGQTPLIDISAMANPKVDGVKILAKAEYLNPGFSMKDRIVKHIFDQAELKGVLTPGMTIVAASSGNTGASCAMIAAMRNYKSVIITNSKCSQEKKDAIKAYGAELVVVPDGVDYMEQEMVLAKQNPTWFSVNQYDNPANPEAHYLTTGKEIFEQTNGQVTHFVASGSTGGTISGVGRYLKEQVPGVKIIMADPYGSIFYDFFKTGLQNPPGKFLVEGVGKNNIPKAMDMTVIDEMLQISDKEAFQTCHNLAKLEGICVGGSSGLNVAAAVKIANEAEKPMMIVTILCDLGVKYLTKVYNQEYLTSNGIQLY